MGASQLSFEHLASSGSLAKHRLLLRKPIGSRRRVGKVVLVSSVERSGGLVQLPTHSIPSRGGLRHLSFVPRLLLVTMRGRCRHGQRVSSLCVVERRVHVREFLRGYVGEILSERVVLCDFLPQDRFELRLPLSSLLGRVRPIIGRATDRFAERALGLGQLPLERESCLTGLRELRFTHRETLRSSLHDLRPVPGARQGQHEIVRSRF